MLIKKCTVESIKVVTEDDNSNLDDNKTRNILKKAAKELTKKVIKQAGNKNHEARVRNHKSRVWYADSEV